VRASSRRSRLLAPIAGAAGLVLAAAPPAEAQIIWEDLVFTAGASVEGYRGNFSSVTVPVVDSTDAAGATVGELSAAGSFLIAGDRVRVGFDAGVRQFAANGFELRDYAPREWVGELDIGWGTWVGDVGTLSLSASGRARSVADRPPLPLFLQPGHTGYQARARFDSRLVQDVRFDVAADLERTDYDAPTLLSQLDLLDRRSWGMEIGASFGPLTVTPERAYGWSLRFYSAFRGSEYRDQSSFDPADPFRRDRTVQVGGTWRYRGSILAEVGVEGTINRSNSQRPEYDAVSVRGVVSTPLPWWGLGVNGLAMLTGKSYVHDVPFSRLVPGEEADNASIVYLELDRPVAPNLSAATRFGWTRAETDIGEQYYSRFGMTFLVRYRPQL